MSRIFFINRFYHPDNSATAQLLTSLAEYLAAKDMDVVVTTSRLDYVTGNKIYLAHEKINGVEIHRLQTTAFGRDSLIGRAFDYLSFYFNCLLFLLFKTTRKDIIVVKTDPPMLSVIAMLVSIFKRYRYITWNQDLFPEIAEKSLSNIKIKFIYRWLRNVRDLSLSKSFLNIFIGEMMCEKLHNLKHRNTEQTIIHNWNVSTNKSQITPLDLKTKWNIKEKFVVGYSGNLGKAHNPKILYKAIKKLSEIDSIHFLFIGNGSGMQWLKQKTAIAKLSNITFLPYQPIELLRSSLCVPDIHLISLNSEMEGLIVPSKFYGILSVGKPMIFIGGKDGELVRLINKHQCGISVDENEAQGLILTIKHYHKSPDDIEQHANNSRLAYQQYYSPEISLEKWHQELKNAQENFNLPTYPQTRQKPSHDV